MYKLKILSLAADPLWFSKQMYKQLTTIILPHVYNFIYSFTPELLPHFTFTRALTFPFTQEVSNSFAVSSTLWSIPVLWPKVWGTICWVCHFYPLFLGPTLRLR